MIEEILKLGFDHVELGFDLMLPLVPGVKKMVEQKSVIVDSLHNYCPVPVSAPRPTPELFLMASLDRREREMAVKNTARTISFAAEIGARCVNMHGGYIDMWKSTPDLIDLYTDGKQYSDKYDKLKMKLLMVREKKAKKHLDSLCLGVEALMPELERTNVVLAFENLPFWEAVPSEMEMEEIHRRFNSPLIRYWHDMGHGQIRENLGFISHKRWMEKLSPLIAGMHIHDVLPPAHDHLMPSRGEMDFSAFKSLIRPDMILVLEPSPNTSEAEIRAGMNTITAAWGIAVK
jgi:sugar phosphate isomerase/epimerase